MQIKIAAWQSEFTHWSSFSLVLVEEHSNEVIFFCSSGHEEERRKATLLSEWENLPQEYQEQGCPKG